MPLTLKYNIPVAGSTISLPITGNNVIIDWGGLGTELSGYRFTYTTPGIKMINITGTVISLIYDLDVTNNEYLIECVDFGNVGLETISFYGAINLTTVPLTLPTSITNISNMFAYTNFNQNISSWNLSNITDMSFMFYNNFTFNKPVNWQNMPTQLCSMKAMFNSATSFNQSVSSWDVSKITDMSYMFYNATSFNHSIPNSWHLDNIQDMSHMFHNATAFNSTVEWDINAPVPFSMLSAFENATLFNQDVSKWDISNVSILETTFKNTNLSIYNYNKLLNKWGNLPNLQETNFSNNLLVYTAKGIPGRQKLINKGWDLQDDILLIPSTIYKGEPFVLKYNHGIWNPGLYGGIIIISHNGSVLDQINININTRDLLLKPIKIYDTGKIQLVFTVKLSNGTTFVTEDINLYINPRPMINKPKMSMGSLFTNNANVYYKPHSLASGGIGGVRNYRKKSKKT